MAVPAGVGSAAHAAGVERLLASYRMIPATASVRLAKPTSNLFRARARNGASGLDTSGLTGVISVDPETRTADVAGMCTYQDLLVATLPFGLSPLVVPQLKTITPGGAVAGLGIEPASFRNGMPHESVLELDILTGTGEVLTASPEHHPDLYRAFPNSYGTLGYSVRLRIGHQLPKTRQLPTGSVIEGLLGAMEPFDRGIQLAEQVADYHRTDEGIVWDSD